MEGEKRLRCTNFSADETEMLVNLVNKYRNVVECKATDVINNQEKDRIWEVMANEFNALLSTGRTNKMLRNKWDSLKKTSRKEYSKLKNNYYKTGGGSPIHFKFNTILEKVLGIIGVSATGIHNDFDSDNIENIPSTYSEDCNEEIVIQFEDKWSKWNPQMLRTPINKKLKISENDTILHHKDDIEDVTIQSAAPECVFSLEDGIADAAKSSTVFQEVQSSSTSEMQPNIITDILATNNLKRKRKTKCNCLGSQQQKIIAKKMELLELQIKTLAEEHEVKMLILHQQLLNEKNKK